MTENLKKCPFCGGEAKIQPFSNPEYYFNVVCKGCGVQVNYFWETMSFDKSKTEKENAKINKQKIIEAWNTRAADENPPLTLNDLRQMEGEPVWIVPTEQWRIVCVNEDGFVTLFSIFNTVSAKSIFYNDGLIYRRKPEVQR